MSNPIVCSTIIDTICLRVPNSYHHHILTCDMFVLGFMRFRVLLGMDWLAETEMILDCAKRLVTLKDLM